MTVSSQPRGQRHLNPEERRMIQDPTKLVQLALMKRAGFADMRS